MYNEEEAIGIFSTMMIDLTDKLSSVIDKHGEGVADMVLLYARIESVTAILTVIALCVVIYLCHRIGAKLYKSINYDSCAPTSELLHVPLFLLGHR